MIAAFEHAALAISAAVIDSVWEGVPIVAAVWLALRVLSNLGAATRYAVWLCTLAALFVLPAVNLWAGAPHNTAAATPQTIAAQSIVEPAKHVIQPIAVSQQAAPTTTIAPDATARSTGAPQIAIPQILAIGIALAWIIAAGIRALLLLRDLSELAVLRNNAEQWSNSAGYPVFTSNAIRVPLALGFFRPAVVLPTAMTQELTPNAIDAVLAHEVAHLRRLDVWTNGLARVIEIFVVLNPLAWLALRRLSIEREIACDDWVVAQSNGGEIFARTLASLASRPNRAPLAAPSAVGSRHAVVERIEQLLDSHPRRLRPSFSALGIALAFIAVAAILLQSVSPVFAYAPQTIAESSTQPDGAIPFPGTTQPDASCNRPIQIASSMGFRMGKGFQERWYPAEEAAKIVARFTSANVAVVDLTVDASGTPHAKVVSAPLYPGIEEYVTDVFAHDKYAPAEKNCVAVTSTIRTGLRVEKPIADSLSVVAPSYPDGWSAAHPNACKVPNLLHTGVPAFPNSVTGFSVMSNAKASARVTVDDAGSVTNAAILTSTNQPAFDNALLEAARGAIYPLNEATGFKPVRPSNTTLAWNAENGYAVYSKCSPKPKSYIWNTTFKPIVPIGMPGSSVDATIMGMNFAAAAVPEDKPASVAMGSSCRDREVMVTSPFPKTNFPASMDGLLSRITVDVSASGSVNGASVYKTSGNPEFDQQVERLARSATYTPATHNCQTVEGKFIFMLSTR